MKRLVIAVDCDDVLVPGTEACVRMYNRIYGTEVQLEGAHKGENPDWQTGREELVRRFAIIQSSDEYAEIAPYFDAIEACKRLAKEHELHLVTARDSKVMPVTHAMVERHFPGVFTEIEHVGTEGSKGVICSRLSADVLIDDNMKHLEDARDYGVSNLIWFGDYPWNRLDRPGEDVAYCLDWLSVEQEIERIARS